MGDTGMACSASTDIGANQSAAVGKIPVTWELKSSHYIRYVIELSFLMQSFHYTFGTKIRFCYRNRILVFSKSLQMVSAIMWIILNFSVRCWKGILMLKDNAISHTHLNFIEVQAVTNVSPEEILRCLSSLCASPFNLEFSWAYDFS